MLVRIKYNEHLHKGASKVLKDDPNKVAAQKEQSQWKKTSDLTFYY